MRQKFWLLKLFGPAGYLRVSQDFFVCYSCLFIILQNLENIDALCCSNLFF